MATTVTDQPPTKRRKTIRRLCVYNDDDSGKCTKYSVGPTQLCVRHGGGKRCSKVGCTKSAVHPTNYCVAHGGGRRCKYSGCSRSAAGKTALCVSHGGGRRCKIDGCNKSAAGATDRCKLHGGGKRCKWVRGDAVTTEQQSGEEVAATSTRRRARDPEKCEKAAEGASDYCRGHGGGKRCGMEGCTKSAQGATGLCRAHGGGKYCSTPRCFNKVFAGTLFCKTHVNMPRCSTQGCSELAETSSSDNNSSSNTSTNPSAAVYCSGHKPGRPCASQLCGGKTEASSRYCIKHMTPTDYCEQPGCSERLKADKGDGKHLCSIHALAKVCSRPGCGNAVGELDQYCGEHQTNKTTCLFVSCTSKALESSPFCRIHSGSSCLFPACVELVVQGAQYCQAHLGGKKCKVNDCTKLAWSLIQPLCSKHGGGFLCEQPGCFTEAYQSASLCRKHMGARLWLIGRPKQTESETVPLAVNL